MGMAGAGGAAARCCLFCKRLRPELDAGGGGGDGSASGAIYVGGADAAMDCLPARRRGRRPEGGMGCEPMGDGRVREDSGAGGSAFFLGSGSGAHVSMGRWSDGSTSRPSSMTILPAAFVYSVGLEGGFFDAATDGLKASNESGPNGMSDCRRLSGGGGTGLTDLRLIA